MAAGNDLQGAVSGRLRTECQPDRDQFRAVEGPVADILMPEGRAARIPDVWSSRSCDDSETAPRPHDRTGHAGDRPLPTRRPAPEGIVPAECVQQPPRRVATFAPRGSAIRDNPHRLRIPPVRARGRDARERAYQQRRRAIRGTVPARPDSRPVRTNAIPATWADVITSSGPSRP